MPQNKILKRSAILQSFGTSSQDKRKLHQLASSVTAEGLLHSGARRVINGPEKARGPQAARRHQLVQPPPTKLEQYLSYTKQTYHLIINLLIYPEVHMDHTGLSHIQPEHQVLGLQLVWLALVLKASSRALKLAFLEL